MKKYLYNGISTLSGVITDVYDPSIDDVPEYEVSRSDLDGVLDEIFSVDERTGLPKGDIQYYLSKDGNPQVKAWLERNLMLPRSKANGSSLEDVSDDLIAEMSKNVDESYESYVGRLASIRDEIIQNEQNS